jgi:hypothetical protein
LFRVDPPALKFTVVSTGELMEELTRQSAIADRPIALLEVSAVERDLNYEETKLVVKYKHGDCPHFSAAAFYCLRVHVW